MNHIRERLQRKLVVRCYVHSDGNGEEKATADGYFLVEVDH